MLTPPPRRARARTFKDASSARAAQSTAPPKLPTVAGTRIKTERSTMKHLLYAFGRRHDGDFHFKGQVFGDKIRNFYAGDRVTTLRWLFVSCARKESMR